MHVGGIFDDEASAASTSLRVPKNTSNVKRMHKNKNNNDDDRREVKSRIELGALEDNKLSTRMTNGDALIGFGTSHKEAN
ncbi:hypothetical protein KQX54_001733 [Cotesia glomerata]|uniref:Uncharacterized protein n=1 Tax=Cotesia glomerata TaxID=32391 RepID=A0AAV7ITT3_COTGL|nr:hypothetical protein KQX54_001733 [Cotesia glomerata]